MEQEQRSTSGAKAKTKIRREDGRGAKILVLGILSLGLLGPLSGIPAWVMANKDLKKIKFGIIPKSEKSIIKAGKILGIIGTCVIAGAIILGILTVVVINLVTG